jgi:hypothetical protein
MNLKSEDFNHFSPAAAPAAEFNKCVNSEKAGKKMKSKKLHTLPHNRAILLDNLTCPYCGVELDSSNDTKEHVIGRKFVPKGKFNGYWNLIVRACGECNSKKSHLEDDISAITLANKLWFNSSDEKDDVVSEAKRKAKNSFSNKTNKLVMKSQEEVNFEIPISKKVTLKFNMVSPPQIESHRLYELAHFQLMAFVYYVSFDKQKRRGYYWPGGFYPLSDVQHGDWGNSLQKSFMTAVAEWEPRWIGNTADGFFKSIIRRHPCAECWSWAIEWNKNYRIIGFFGDGNAAQEFVKSFEVPEIKTVRTSSSSHIKFRSDVPLEDEDDLMFGWDDEAE